MRIQQPFHTYDNMHGQISFEYLILFSLSLALLSVSLFSVFEVRHVGEFQSDIYKFRQSSTDLYQAMISVCTLGGKNERTVEISYPLSVTYNQKIIRFYTSLNSSYVQDLPCSYYGSSTLPRGKYSIKNNIGRVEVSTIP